MKWRKSYEKVLLLCVTDVKKNKNKKSIDSCPFLSFISWIEPRSQTTFWFWFWLSELFPWQQGKVRRHEWHVLAPPPPAALLRCRVWSATARRAQQRLHRCDFGELEKARVVVFFFLNEREIRCFVLIFYLSACVVLTLVYYCVACVAVGLLYVPLSLSPG